MIQLDLSDYVSLAGVFLGLGCTLAPAVIAGVEFLVSKRKRETETRKKTVT